MAEAEKTLLLLLAAGGSARFGAADKLAEPFLGRPLALHAVTALDAVRFMVRIAIVGTTAVDFGAHGYRVIANPAPEAGMSSSLKLGVQAARELGAAAIMVVLADMPRVTAAQIYRLLDAARTADDVIASSDGHRPMPPALFAAGRFADLMGTKGDEGGRALIAGARHILTDPNELIDIDTPDDLARLHALVHA